MKQLLFSAILLATSLTLIQCKNNLKINAKNTAIKGDLSEYFEVVDRDYNIINDTKDKSHFLIIDIKRKNIEIPTSVSQNINSVEFDIELFDKNGPVQIINFNDNLISNIGFSDAVKKLFKLKPGEVGFLKWEVNAPDKLKFFQLNSSLDFNAESSVPIASQVYSLNLTGTINNKYPIKMILEIDRENVTGSYYYTKHNNPILLSGTLVNEKMILTEYGTNVSDIGVFNGVYNKNSFAGTWSNKGTKTFPFFLAVENSTSVAKEPSEPIFSGGKQKGNRNWDEFLDAYERYVDEYILLLRRSKNGDVAALTAYADFYKKSAELLEILKEGENAGELTPGQAARMLRIQAKLAENIE